MKKLSKDCLLSTTYKKWEEAFEINTPKKHDPYTSSSGEYYCDIVMNLYHCQNGLCAYTEMRICSDSHYTKDKWKDGRYSENKPANQGSLDHFDPDLKEDRGWLWGNFFMIESNVNNKKWAHPVDPILKPDAPDYDEFKLLEYNDRHHVFIANTNLTEEEQAKINKTILILGINYDPIQNRRMRYLYTILKEINFGMINWDDAEKELYEFPTAFKMIRKKYDSK